MKRTVMFILGAVILLSAAGCQRISDFTRGAGAVRQTAEAGISQAQALATQSANILGTAQAFATQNPSLVGTAQAFFTEQGPALLETAQALGTQYPGLLETAQAVATQGPPQTGLPEDIPIAPGDAQVLSSTAEQVTYISGLDYRSALEFYRVEMPNAGWSPVAQGTMESESVAVLNYTRPERSASVTINASPDGRSIISVVVR
jgi:hypothetical protein